jgi:hypothetical protein
MIDRDTIDNSVFENTINTNVIALSPAVSIGSNMLALAGAMSRDYSNATNQQQLNYMTSMRAAIQTVGAGNPSGDARAVDEAMGLLKQVLAAVQAN